MVGSGRLFAWAFGLVLASTVASFGDVINGQFDSDLAGWTAMGEVYVQGGHSVLRDDASVAQLYQGVALPPGFYTFEFDFEHDLSAARPSDTGLHAFPDAFFVSVYFVSQLSQFDLIAGPFANTPLLDLGAAGPTGVSGRIDPSGVGPGWRHFTWSFQARTVYAVPVFELFDLNGAGGDSSVGIDNVRILGSGNAGVVPEPTALVLLGFGLVGLLVRRGRGRPRVSSAA